LMQQVACLHQPRVSSDPPRPATATANHGHGQPRPRTALPRPELNAAGQPRNGRSSMQQVRPATARHGHGHLRNSQISSRRRSPRRSNLAGAPRQILSR
jgi:hypothetical protein